MHQFEKHRSSSSATAFLLLSVQQIFDDDSQKLRATPAFVDEGSVNLDVWEKVGKQLKTYHAEHGSEKVPNDAFSLWNIIRDVLDPVPDSEKVHLKRDSEENAVVKPTPESKKVTFKEENEVEIVVKPVENEKNEDPPDYRQLRKMLAAMTTQEQLKDRDEKQDQPSPKGRENLDEITAKYHSDEDRHLLNKDAPKGLRETSPVRPSAPKSLRETSPIRLYAPRDSQETFPVNPYVTSAYQTVQRAPEYRTENIEPMPLPPPPIPPPIPSRTGPIKPTLLLPPPYRSGKIPKSIPRRWASSAPGEKFDPQLQACFPLIFDNDEREQKAIDWEPVSFQLVKELKNACISYGPKAPYTMQLVENLAGQCLTPREWKSIARACLSGGHFILWKDEYDDLARIYAFSNQNGDFTHITEPILLGQADYPSYDEQMKLDRTTIQQVADCAFTAWRSLPDGTASGAALSDIKQKSEEPFEDFVSRLSEAVQRIISDSEAAKLLTKHLAFENANSTCQAILRPLRRTGSLIDYMKQCADVGPSMLQGVAIAAAITGNSYQQTVQSFFTNKNKPSQSDPNNQSKNAFPKTCFSCGQEGHTSRYCPQRTPGSYLPNPAQPAVSAPQNPAPPPMNTRSLCPRCQKGYHWARDCRSRLHRNGALLGPDQQSGNGLRGQPQAPTTIGADSLNPFIPFVPSQSSSEQPQAAQDWTSVPPPQQY
ncbi:PREDICTED: endogenous retrovirus group K member 8 Gag polyprotein-like [Bison bison bison]|uniref:Endogenous retrovirus group K member 8 Gag polyprotein-like n=1 Tax=Bison bison bison TaxID=43346 RepID=A0A6P3HYB8_BISBB|nr:PREDICTED: endogenous retrovirus group K member 8 Gag polyprotein-like [Bison bison bison]